MLKKIYRLSTVRLGSFNRVTSASFDIKISKNNMNISRFGFVISKKIDKRAVARNSAKRKLSKSIEEIFDRIEIGRDFVFYPRQIMLDINQKDLTKELEIALQKEKLLHD